MGSNTRSTIHLLGDAILDNYYWLSDKDRDLRKEIASLGYLVHNYAVDETKVYDLFNGMVPGDSHRTNRPYAYPVEKDGKMYPLQLLAQNIGVNRSFSSTYGGIKPISKEAELDHMAVISIGGGDLGNNALKVLLGFDTYMNSVLTKEFVETYERVLDTILRSCEKVVLVSIYLPYLGSGSTYGLFSGFANPLIERWGTFLQKLGKKFNIPVLDLTRTFNSNDRSHYGSIETRPSNKSNKCIAECLSYIQKHYQGHKVYYAENCNSSNITVE